MVKINVKENLSNDSKKKLDNNKKNKIKNNTNNIKCRYCGSIYCVKHGKTSTSKNRYLCKNCNRNFSLNDNRIKHPMEHIFLALILLNKNVSKRNIQKTLQELYKIKLSYSVLDRWFKTFEYLLDDNKEKDKDKNISKKIDILEMDELWSYYYDLKKKEEKESKYGLLLIGTEIKLLHIK